jgi:Thioredoxin-like [2Fe-2S] ferredoxin
VSNPSRSFHTTHVDEPVTRELALPFVVASLETMKSCRSTTTMTALLCLPLPPVRIGLVVVLLLITTMTMRSTAALLVPMAGDPSLVGFSMGRRSRAARAFIGSTAPRAATEDGEEAMMSDGGSPSSSSSLPQKVQVCGFKDCRRVGGGKKLENLVNQVLQEEAGEHQGNAGVDVEVCDCLGECGYGPNLVVDGRIVNGVRGRMAVMQALGMAAVSASSSTANDENNKAEASPPPSAASPPSLERMTAASSSSKEAA